jgi:hypothetical protein
MMVEVAVSPPAQTDVAEFFLKVGYYNTFL